VESKDYEYRRTDLDTGETNRWIGKPSGDKITSKEPFLMLYQAACRDIATNRDLQGFGLRVFIFLAGILDTENWVDVHHGRIARQMGDENHKVHRTAVTRSINRLVAEKILLKGEERTYRLNPGIGWKGDKAKQAAAEKDAISGRLSVVRP